MDQHALVLVFAEPRQKGAVVRGPQIIALHRLQAAAASIKRRGREEGAMTGGRLRFKVVGWFRFQVSGFGVPGSGFRTGANLHDRSVRWRAVMSDPAEDVGAGEHATTSAEKFHIQPHLALRRFLRGSLSASVHGLLLLLFSPCIVLRRGAGADEGYIRVARGGGAAECRGDRGAQAATVFARHRAAREGEPRCCVCDAQALHARQGPGPGSGAHGSCGRSSWQ